MSQVQGFVGIRRRKFDHHRLSVGRERAKISVKSQAVERVYPSIVRNTDIQKTLYDVKITDNCRVFAQKLPQSSANLNGRLAEAFGVGKSNERIETRKVFFGGLQ